MALNWLFCFKDLMTCCKKWLHTPSEDVFYKLYNVTYSFSTLLNLKKITKAL